MLIRLTPKHTISSVTVIKTTFINNIGMKINEITGQRQYYHGSYEELPIGTVLRPRDEAYERDWQHTDFYSILEQYRPPEMLSHKNAVFMCDNPDDVDVAGGATEWLLIVVPLGKVERHDLNWSSEISMLVSSDDADNTVAIKQAAHNYWQGIPHHSETVWEYLTPSAQVVAVERY
jgi:hypothetical protein